MGSEWGKEEGRKGIEEKKSLEEWELKMSGGKTEIDDEFLHLQRERLFIMKEMGKEAVDEWRGERRQVNERVRVKEIREVEREEKGKEEGRGEEMSEKVISTSHQNDDLSFPNKEMKAEMRESERNGSDFSECDRMEMKMGIHWGEKELSVRGEIGKEKEKEEGAEEREESVRTVVLGSEAELKETMVKKEREERVEYEEGGREGNEDKYEEKENYGLGYGKEKERKESEREEGRKGDISEPCEEVEDKSEGVGGREGSGWKVERESEICEVNKKRKRRRSNQEGISAVISKKYMPISKRRKITHLPFSEESHRFLSDLMKGLRSLHDYGTASHPQYLKTLNEIRDISSDFVQNVTSITCFPK